MPICSPGFVPSAAIDPRMERATSSAGRQSRGRRWFMVMTLHDEFIDLLNTPPQTPDQPVGGSTTLGEGSARRGKTDRAIFINGVAGCYKTTPAGSMFPYEVSAFDERKTTVMIALQIQATRSSPASALHASTVSTFMNARLLKIQFDRLQSPGAVRR